MKATIKNAAFGLALSAFVFCGQRGLVGLTVDFSSQREWRYTLSVDLRGTIATPDTQRDFSSNAGCRLIGSPVPGQYAMLHVRACSVDIAMPLLSDAEKNNLIRQCNNVQFTLNLDKGSITPDDPDDLPLVKIGEWDLYKDMAKVLPALPRGMVRKGFSWDREKQMPIETKHGSGVGHLFQSFTLDSIFIDPKGSRMAIVTWKFTYGVEVKSVDSAGRFGDVPVKGGGQGNALLNISGKTLEKASIHFSVPSTKQGKIKISWEEDIKLIRDKSN
jgi:hypothetical protein